MASLRTSALPAWLGPHAREAGGLAGLAFLGLTLALSTPHFLTVSNLLNVAQQTAINAVIAAGMTYVIISGGIDLSVGSIVALSGVLLAKALKADWPTPLALAVGLAAGAGCGVVNGLLVTRGRLPPFIATLGMMSVARGAALRLADGRPISGFEAGFRSLATAEPLGVPMPAWLMLGVYAAGQFVLQRTALGRYVYAIGGNEEAARLSGVNVRLHKTVVYAVSGLAAGFGAILLTARLNSAQPTAGGLYELDAIAAAVIGGASLLGGAGSLVGTLIGALIMGVLRNGLTLLNVSSYVQQIVIGAAIILAVLMDLALKRRQG